MAPVNYPYVEYFARDEIRNNFIQLRRIFCSTEARPIA